MDYFRKSLSTFGIVFLLNACGGGSSSPLETVVHLSSTYIISKDDAVIENTHFICDDLTFEALKISNASNVQIRGNLFEDCATAINLNGAFKTIITGNRFNKLGTGITTEGNQGEEGTIIIYNEFTNMGIYDCNVATGGNNCNIYGPRSYTKNTIFSHNLIDNRGANARYMEDYIGLYSGSSQFEQNISVEDNLLIGSKVSSSSGACIIAYGMGSGYSIKRNQCYNVSGYGIGAASARNLVIEENRVYMDREHIDAITVFNSDIHRDGSYAFAVTNFYGGVCAQNVQFINNESYGDFTDMGNIAYGWQCLGDDLELDYYDLNGGDYQNNITLKGNQFWKENPGWKVPENIFKGLDSRYFSGS